MTKPTDLKCDRIDYSSGHPLVKTTPEKFRQPRTAIMEIAELRKKLKRVVEDHEKRLAALEAKCD